MSTQLCSRSRTERAFWTKLEDTGARRGAGLQAGFQAPLCRGGRRACPWHSGLWQSGFVIPFPQADKQLIVLRKQLHLGRFSFWVWQHREALPSIRPEALPSPGFGEVSWQGLGFPGHCSKSGASNNTVYIQFSRSGDRHGLGSFAEALEKPLFLAMPWAELSFLGLYDWMSTSRLAVRWGLSLAIRGFFLLLTPEPPQLRASVRLLLLLSPWPLSPCPQLGMVLHL